MKLGNRKVVISGLTAVAFTSLTAFTNVTPDTTSDTNLISATPSVLDQNFTLADSGIVNFSSLFMPGQLTTTLDAIIADTSFSATKKPVKAQAGIAKLFTQSETLANLGTVTASDEDTVELSKAALNNDNVGEEATDTSVENTDTALAAGDATTDTQIVTQDSTSQEQDTPSQEVESEVPAEDTTGFVPSAQEVQVPTQADTQVEVNTSTDETNTSKEAEVSEWANKVMANVKESVNIRAEANEEAEVVGKLYKGAEADILEKGDEWTKISSGSVTEGYVKNEFLAFDDEAEALAAQDGKLVATVTTDALRIRKEASEDAAILNLAENGEELNVISQDGDWVEVQYTSDTNGFVSSQFVTVDYVLGKAMTIEEEKAMIAEQKRKEAEAKQAEIAASEDAALLAAVVRMEAGGESYEGKLAVASVVVNRVRSGAYPNSVSGVVYQNGQFPGAANGTLAGFLTSGVGGDCKKAAVEALSGITNVEYYHFNSVSRIGTNGYVIGNHCFY
jgi:SH3-like domain-containing protein